MKSIYKYLTGSFCLVAAFLLAIGCSEEYEYSTDYSFYDNVKLKVNLVDENNVLSVKLANGKHSLTIAVTPEDVLIDSKAYIYEIGDTSIATVEQDGTITLLKVGETTLTVKFRGNKEISTSCTLRVEPTLISDLNITGDNIRVEEGKELDLSQYVVVVPSAADNKTLRYEVKEGFADYAEMVDESSVVKGLKEGDAIIVVSTVDGSEISKEIPLKVTGKIPVERIDLNNAANLEGKTVPVGQFFDLGSVVTVYPSNASDKTLNYKLVAGDGVVSIDENGMVETLASGDVAIDITPADGLGVAGSQTIRFKVDASKTLFERALWFVDTSIVYANGKNYTTDKDTGNPEHLIDGKTTTYLALTKPGKKYNEEVTPADHVLFFVVDMQAEQEFNYFQYVHRNTTANFQAFKISMFGSNDNENYTAIEEDIAVGPATESSKVTFEKSVATSSYRYIKVVFRDWNKDAGINITVAEFNVGKK